ncbi:DUF4355 domain-containing protein [Listeria booriae]|uniref:DUF4355 domain-containing protein n=1 Tax=Listeria booriae TaxID=1552123 RepID=A0A7X0YJM6_9LIST|nr:DUF4355 domain-containing protein [Listeria booriae]MBC1290624.1 DUF4355 domain-containing protein [Listeria booriae]MBC2115692.1 DUF4355 domain-containing protein [Listeria booriae]
MFSNYVKSVLSGHKFSPDLGGGSGSTEGGDSTGSGSSSDDGAGEDGDAGSEKEGNADRTFTREELAAIVAKEVKKTADSFENKIEERVKEAQTKAEKMAKLTESERQSAEFQEKQEKLDAREKELQLKEYRIEAKKQLEDNKLPVDFVDFVLSDAPEKTIENIKVIKKSFDQAVTDEVTKKLAGKAPGAGNVGGKASFAESLAKQANNQSQPKNDAWA